MAFQESFKTLRESLATGDNLNLFDDIFAEFVNTADALQSANSKIDELTKQISERDNSITELKSKNWDLLNKIPIPEPEPGNEDMKEPNIPEYSCVKDLFN